MVREHEDTPTNEAVQPAKSEQTALVERAPLKIKTGVRAGVDNWRIQR